MQFVKWTFFGAVLAASFYGGWQINQKATGFQVTRAQVTQLQPTISRDPAAIHKTYDFSHLAGEELDLASKERLVGSAAVHTEGAEVAIELGDFVVMGTNGQKTFACQQYAQIILQFEGDGSAVNGQKPMMEVEGTCEVAKDINMIAPLWIPVAKILGEPVADGEFDFRENHPVRVRFANLYQEWPAAWRLNGLKLVSAQGPAQSVEVSDRDIRKLSKTPLIVTFRPE